VNWGYAYSPYIWPSLATISALILLAVYSWRRRQVPGALPFAVGSLFAAIWAAGALMEVSALDPSTKLFWFKFHGAVQLPAVTAITCFVLDYTWPGRWLTRRNLVLFSLPPLLFLALILTSGFHRLAWRGFTFDETVIPLRGPGTWFFLAYGYGLGLVNIVLFTWLWLRSPPHRLPVVIMLTGQIGARAIYLLETVKVIHFELPLDPLVLGCVDLVYAIALFGFRIFNPVQLARQTVVAQMREGMIVLDLQGRVASLNPAAQVMLGAPDSRYLGRLFEDVVPEYSQANEDYSTAGLEPIEIYRQTGAGDRCYSLERSSLKDWRGVEIGRLLLLHDMTEQKRAQAELVVEQRTGAARKERERLARELHDSLGQTLAATHLQASTARLLLARGETAETDRYLEEMAAISIAAEADVRDYLLGAKTAYSADLTFFPALGLYAKRFGQQYRLRITLNVPEQVEHHGLQPAIEVQLMRIIQEALSNVRKHARAEMVRIDFACSGASLQINICDDGQGFEPAVVARKSERYGLQSMRERAEELGGTLQVVSQPGQGTQVLVQVPLNGHQPVELT
jgi:PAS domain S-box-containing protein